ncbi:RlpA-like double-psi beta-barrel domain [Phaffia rhodozyma]|uniref:RlpA-like double-psi beta-barrel domain n=1 Tax=Phaffia rhodozyma TaxID=264483 RepID=A0A0F7SXU0_PHARH|nr:RlpA-like double-psi beta-barrel domain [Phaffia rhodozyma]
MLAFAPVALLATCLTLVQAAPARHHQDWSNHNQAVSSAVSSASGSAAATTTTSAAAAATSTTTSAAAAATSTAASSSDSYSGHATYFTQGGNAGACGTVHSDSDYIVAVPYAIWGTSDSEASSTCGKTINIVRTSDGASVSAVVADLCPSCTSTYSIDLSVGAFTAIAIESEGEVDVTWTWA